MAQLGKICLVVSNHYGQKVAHPPCRTDNWQATQIPPVTNENRRLTSAYYALAHGPTDLD